MECHAWVFIAVFCMSNLLGSEENLGKKLSDPVSRKLYEFYKERSWEDVEEYHQKNNIDYNDFDIMEHDDSLMYAIYRKRLDLIDMLLTQKKINFNNNVIRGDRTHLEKIAQLKRWKALDIDYLELVTKKLIQNGAR